MDDRFRNEGSDGFGGQNSGSYYPTKTPSLGDFSVNIDSRSASEGVPMASKPKKFELHIPDIDDVPVTKPSSAPRSAAPRSAASSQTRRPSGTAASSQARRASQAQPARRPASGTGQSAQRRPASGNPKAAAAKRPANGRTASKAQKPSGKSTAPSKAKKRTSRRKYNFVQSVLVTCVCLIFITILTVTASTVALAVINDILVINSDDQSSVYVEIPEGSDYDEVFNILADKGLIKQPLITDIFCKFRHYDEVDIYDKNGAFVETRRIEYEPGSYYLDADAGVENLLESIMVRSNVAKDTIRLTFPEGWSVAQVFEKIEKYEVCEAEKLYANLEIIGDQYTFISEIKNVSGRYLKAEGYLFPDTYDFYIGENASSVLKKLFNNFESRWTAEYSTRLKELGMTQDQIINIASIIQREAKDGTQMADISSVIHNRLKDSATYPNLEMNSTRDYISSLKEYNLFSDVYYSLYLDKYNTYSQTGLPPGPICNPGKAAIEAALYPADTDYYFFCHDTSTGEIYLAETAAEHQENTARVLYGNIGG